MGEGDNCNRLTSLPAKLLVTTTMKESTQTLLFLFAALASVFAATWSRPVDATYEVDDLIGQPLFNAFETETASAMRIVRFDEETATLSDFEVAEQDGVWSIPSKGGYPSDAETQMAEATTGVIDLEILAIASQDATDHADYGVIEPSQSIEPGQTGVGTRVTLEDTKSEALVDIVIGKEVKGATDQHYVRKPTQDVVYVVRIDPEDFSTNFEDWIEDDLLKLSTWDISRVQIKDYSAELVMQGLRPALAFDPRADLTLAYDDKESEWLPFDLKRYDADAQSYVNFELGANEVLNKETLDALKNAVGDLKIVDVERKPSGLSADLKAGDDLFEDQASVQSLMQRGFAPTRSETGETEVLSSEGEVLVTLKDGVEYVLRFGKLQLSDESSQSESSEESDDDSGVSRYLFVMARLNKSMIESPELEVVPEEQATEEGEQADESSANEGSEDVSEDATSEDTEESDREAIIKRNQRLLDEYEQKLADAQKQVDELNARFGDWYYVISDEVYKKIAIGQKDLIKIDESAANEEPAAEKNEPDALLGLPSLPGMELSAEAAEVPASEGLESNEVVEEGPAEEEPAAEAVTE